MAALLQPYCEDALGKAEQTEPRQPLACFAAFVAPAGSGCKNTWPGEPFVPTFRGTLAALCQKRCLHGIAGCGAPAYRGLHSGKLLLHMEAKARAAANHARPCR